MKYAYWIIGSLIGIVVLLFTFQFIVAERVEVIEIHTVQQYGETTTTRLWIVDDDGYQYLRSSSGSSGWLAYVPQGREFTLTRDESTARYTAVPRTDKREVINDLMQEKYGWSNSFVLMRTYGGVNAIPMELHPAGD